MLLKTGVDISRLRPEIRKKLEDMEIIYFTIENKEMVITSTYEGVHSPGSLHYANLAVDLRHRRSGPETVNAIRKKLGDDYDVVKEGDHIHIEYDPKGA